MDSTATYSAYYCLAFAIVVCELFASVSALADSACGRRSPASWGYAAVIRLSRSAEGIRTSRPSLWSTRRNHCLLCLRGQSLSYWRSRPDHWDAFPEWQLSSFDPSLGKLRCFSSGSATCPCFSRSARSGCSFLFPWYFYRFVNRRYRQQPQSFPYSIVPPYSFGCCAHHCPRLNWSAASLCRCCRICSARIPTLFDW